MKNSFHFLQIVLISLFTTSFTGELLSQNYSLYGIIDNQIVCIDLNTGSISHAFPLGTQYTEIEAFTYNSSQDCFYIVVDGLSDPKLVTINRKNGHSTLIGPINQGVPMIDFRLMEALAYNSSNNCLYGVAFEAGPPGTIFSRRIIKIDPSTGIGSPINLINGTCQNDADELLISNGSAYVIDECSGFQNLYNINLTTGGCSLIGNMNNVTNISAIHPTTGLIYSLGHSLRDLYQVSPLNGNTTLIGQTHSLGEFGGSGLQCITFGLEESFIRVKGGLNIDQGVKVIRKSDGNYAILANSYQNSSNENILLTTLNADFTTKDSILIGGPLRDEGSSIVDTGNGIFVSGSSENQNISPVIRPTGYKFNPSLSSLIWGKSYYEFTNNHNGGQMLDVAIYKDTLFIIGYSRNTISGSKSGDFILYIQLSSNGILLDSIGRAFNTNNNNLQNDASESYNSIALDTTRRLIYAVGNSVAQPFNNNPTFPFLSKFDFDGNDVLHSYYNGTRGIFNSVIIDKSDSLMVLGWKYPNTGVVSNGVAQGNFLARLDNSGNFIWGQEYKIALGGNLVLNSITYSKEANYLVGFLENAPIVQGGKDAVLLKVDHRGNVIWGKLYGTSSDDVFNDLILTPDGFFMVGYTESLGTQDILQVKTDCQGNVIENIGCFHVLSFSPTSTPISLIKATPLMDTVSCRSSSFSPQITPLLSFNSTICIPLDNASITLNATVLKDKVYLDWGNLNFPSSSKFEIYRRLSNNDFLYLGSTESFSFYDYSPSIVQSSYRVVGILPNNQKVYSNTVIIRDQAIESRFHIVSNERGKHVLMVSLKESMMNPISCQIYSMEGKIVFTKKLAPNLSKYLEITSLGSFSRGIYVASVQFASGQFLYQKIFIHK